MLSPKEATDLLEDIAKGLEARFASLCLRPLAFKSSTSDFREVTMEELADVILTVNQAAPGPDQITNSMIKLIFNSHPVELLNIVNCSLQHTWIPSAWKIAKVVLLRKNQSLGYVLDNIRPISLTSNLVKIIEKFFIAGSVISSIVRVSFRQGK